MYERKNAKHPSAIWGVSRLDDFGSWLLEFGGVLPAHVDGEQSRMLEEYGRLNEIQRILLIAGVSDAGLAKRAGEAECD